MRNKVKFFWLVRRTFYFRLNKSGHFKINILTSSIRKECGLGQIKRPNFAVWLDLEGPEQLFVVDLGHDSTIEIQISRLLLELSCPELHGRE